MTFVAPRATEVTDDRRAAEAGRDGNPRNSATIADPAEEVFEVTSDVLLLGAAGNSGQLIAAELAARGLSSGWPAAAAAR